jgi:NAD(P)-dependent dehydrogenase (short-subunit alcohol dehydrogenase family)
MGGQPGPIQELLDIDDWDDALDWFTSRETGSDRYSFTKQVMQVWTMWFSKPASACGVRVNSVCPAPIDTPLLGAFRETMTDAAIDFCIEYGGQGPRRRARSPSASPGWRPPRRRS